MHKCGGVYVGCQDRYWPQINNFLGTCSLAAYRLGYINLAYLALPFVFSLPFKSIFSPTVKLKVHIFLLVVDAFN